MAPYRPNANIVLYQRATKNISFDSSVILPYKSTPTPSDNELHTNGRNLIIFIDFILLSSHRKIHINKGVRGLQSSPVPLQAPQSVT
jgi:hypothetical protein